MSALVFDAIDAQLKAHRVLLYIKGSPYAPQCGFSARVVDLLIKHNLDLGYVDILSHPDFRQWLPEHSGWPTFPQLFIDEELIGGCDILCEIEKTGELAKLIAKHKLSQTKNIVDATLETV
jgi:monothiol glutaredoxin